MRTYALFSCLWIFCEEAGAWNPERTILYTNKHTDPRPVYYHGFINNEHYSHYIPGHKETNRMGYSIRAECPTGSVIHVEKASYGNPVDTGNDTWQYGTCDFPNSMLIVRKECEGKQFCQGVTDPCPDLAPRSLAVDYDCRPERIPEPLFDREKMAFQTGVTPHYLLIPGTTAACPKTKEVDVSPEEKVEVYTLSDARSLCDSYQGCTYFVWDAAAGHATFCSGNGWKNTEKSTDYTVGVKPTEFSTPGYAVYLNYAGLCTEGNILGVTSTPDFLKGGTNSCDAKKECTYFTTSSSQGIASIPGYNNRIWLCKSFPTMIPVTHIVAFSVRCWPSD